MDHDLNFGEIVRMAALSCQEFVDGDTDSCKLESYKAGLIRYTIQFVHASGVCYLVIPEDGSWIGGFNQSLSNTVIRIPVDLRDPSCNVQTVVKYVINRIIKLSRDMIQKPNGVKFTPMIRPSSMVYLNDFFIDPMRA